MIKIHNKYKVFKNVEGSTYEFIETNTLYLLATKYPPIINDYHNLLKDIGRNYAKKVLLRSLVKLGYYFTEIKEV